MSYALLTPILEYRGFWKTDFFMEIYASNVSFCNNNFIYKKIGKGRVDT